MDLVGKAVETIRPANAGLRRRRANQKQRLSLTFRPQGKRCCPSPNSTADPHRAPRRQPSNRCDTRVLLRDEDSIDRPTAFLLEVDEVPGRSFPVRRYASFAGDSFVLPFPCTIDFFGAGLETRDE